jgi:hypothetical protein
VFISSSKYGNTYQGDITNAHDVCIYPAACLSMAACRILFAMDYPNGTTASEKMGMLILMLFSLPR